MVKCGHQSNRRGHTLHVRGWQTLASLGIGRRDEICNMVRGARYRGDVLDGHDGDIQVTVVECRWLVSISWDEGEGMAYALLKKNICFVHMPKTSGTWVKRVLSEVEHGNRDGSLTHDLPHRWNYDMIFTVVREPAEWLASVWAHRVRERWDPYPQRIPWQYFLQVTEGCNDNKFPSYIDKITTKLPGVVGWFYNFYTPPQVTVVRKEFDLYEFLHGLGGDPWKHVPVNTGFNSPVVTDEIREKVKASEAGTYRRYGY